MCELIQASSGVSNAVQVACTGMRSKSSSGSSAAKALSPEACKEKPA